MVVSVEDFKDFLKIQFDEEDAVVEQLLLESQAAAEDFCRVEFSEIAPMPVKLAVQLMAAHYFENRDNPDKQSYTAMRMAFENLLYPHRNPDLMF